MFLTITLATVSHLQGNTKAEIRNPNNNVFFHTVAKELHGK